MKYPNLIEIPISQSVIDAFYGYNHNLRIGENEFYDMENLSSARFPVLSPRERRGTYLKEGKPEGMIAKDSLCYVDGKEFVFDQYRIDMDLAGGEKTLVSMGPYVIILPDKKYINTADTSDMGSIEAKITTSSPVSFSLCTEEGGAIEAIASSAMPEDPQNMDMWIDTSTTPHMLKQYSATSAMWVTVPTTFVKISSPGIGAKFSEYDGVEISGLKDAALVDATSGNPIEDASISEIDGSFALWGTGEDYIIITAMLDVKRTLNNAVTISREMPDMDFVLECNNRLWGCKYGLDKDGKTLNEIYACKAGDFKNWSSYLGISTDSFRASCGTDGRFTGAINYLGYPLFFKENYLHKVYGNYPSNFQIQTTPCRGVQRGCGKSLAMVNERLYYKGQNGVCMYDGSLPVEISAALGEELYSDAVAGSHGNRYFISMKDSKGGWHLFCYDAARGLWHREDSTQVRAFCSCQEEMYYMEGNTIRTVYGSGERDPEKVRWMAETGTIYQAKIGTKTMGTTGRKYISQVLLRMSLEAGAWCRVYIQYDSIPDWELVSDITGSRMRSFVVPIRPRRCDHFRLRLEGKGDCRVYTLTKNLETGGDLP